MEDLTGIYKDSIFLGAFNFDQIVFYVAILFYVLIEFTNIKLNEGNKKYPLIMEIRKE